MTNVALSAEALLASLMAQAEGRGVDLVTLRALVEESSQAGARRALASLGLDDERARRDMDELRDWRDDLRRFQWRRRPTDVPGEHIGRNGRRRFAPQLDAPEPARL